MKPSLRTTMMLLALAGSAPSWGQELEKIVVGASGPHNLSYLPVPGADFLHTFSTGGKLSTGQFKETGVFFHTTNQGNPPAHGLRLENMVNDKWAGRAR